MTSQWRAEVRRLMFEVDFVDLATLLSNMSPRPELLAKNCYFQLKIYPISSIGSDHALDICQEKRRVITFGGKRGLRSHSLSVVGSLKQSHFNIIRVQVPHVYHNLHRIFWAVENMYNPTFM